MKSSELQRRLAYARHIRSYLRQLALVTGRIVSRKELLSVEALEALRNTWKLRFSAARKNKFEIPFGEKQGERFVKYVHSLYAANPSEGYLWMLHADDCGLLRLGSVRDINWSFPYEIDPNGILTFVTADSMDKLTVEFSENSQGRLVLAVEVTGNAWPSVPY
jgi:hypothetical protein